MKLEELISQLQAIAKANGDRFRYRLDITQTRTGLNFIFVCEETADGHTFLSGDGASVGEAVLDAANGNQECLRRMGLQNAMKLTELLAKITPPPWKKRNGNPKTENQVCSCRGITIYGPYSAAACGDDALYIEHAANTLPQITSALRLALERVVREVGRDKGTEAASILPQLEAALIAAEEVREP